MNETLIAIFETTFNVLYLAAVWGVVVLMTRFMPSVAAKDRPTAGLIRLAFILLAAGDTWHVGFRVVGYVMGGLGTEVMVVGSPMTLVGLGTLATSYTVTLFYMLLVYVWLLRYNRPHSWFTSLLLAAGLVRLVMMGLPANDWGSMFPPQPMSLYRNLPLFLMGIGITGLIFASAYSQKDRTFQWIGWMIVLSFAFYTPVILFAQQIPLLGMLMIPKTCAYLAVAWIAYRGLWKPGSTAAVSPEVG
jgi:hypothetical protein